MADITEHEIKERFEAARNVAFDPAETGQFAIIPEGFKIEDLEDFQAIPNRHFADERFADVSSLVEYLKKFATRDTMLYADFSASTIKAVIDGHGVERPSHREHKAAFCAQITDKMQQWLSICGRPMSQVDFGLFLEERAVDVVEPEAASVMEMVMTFDATKKVTFKSSQRLSDGQRQFQYVEENEARGAVTFPDHFIVLAPVFNGMEPQRLKFMVRYRIEDGKLRFSVSLHDKATVFRDAFQRCVDAVQTDIDLHIFITG